MKDKRQFAFVQGQLNALVRRNMDRQSEERIAMYFGAIQMAYAAELIDGQQFDFLIDIYVKCRRKKQI